MTDLIFSRIEPGHVPCDGEIGTSVQYNCMYVCVYVSMYVYM